MTPEEFVALHKGHKVRVNESYEHDTAADMVSGAIGAVRGAEDGYVLIDLDDLGANWLFYVHELDLVKDEPLPLPG